VTLSPLDIQPVVEAAIAATATARIGPGRYARWIGTLKKNSPAIDDLNPYGCADAANILYTLGHFPREDEERAASISVIQSLQNAATGLFSEDTHHPYHVTAHCVAALELFDARPIHPLIELRTLDAPGALEDFLDGLNWAEGPWEASHQGAGIYAAKVLCEESDSEWEERYFSWLWQQADPQTGLWRRGRLFTPESKPLFHHLAGSFHYLFNHEYARRPQRYPARLIDLCLEIRTKNLWPPLGTEISFSDIDWVYCLTRSLRQCSHRGEEARQILSSFADQFCGFLLDRINTMPVPFDDIHLLFGSLCALAELQTALPGHLTTRKPLRLVLDRRPFI